MKTRCTWCSDDPVYVSYHDEEWGVPVHDDRLLFEFLVLEGAQAGLSWLTILKKRENYRKAFDHFDVARVARYGQADVDRLLHDSGIVRNRLKIEASIKNAQGVLTIQKEFGTFDDYVWGYVHGVPLQNCWKQMRDIPTKTAVSDQMSRDLKKRGFNFVGTTICYSFMQAVGLVNDHSEDCFRHRELAGAGRGA